MSELKTNIAEYLGVKKKDINIMDSFMNTDKIQKLQSGVILVDIPEYGTVEVSIGKKNKVKEIKSAEDDQDFSYLLE